MQRVTSEVDAVNPEYVEGHERGRVLAGQVGSAPGGGRAFAECGEVNPIVAPDH